MKRHIFAAATVLFATQASAGDAPYVVTLIHGHPIHHETAKEAGIAMGLSIKGGTTYASSLSDSCRELQRFAELPGMIGDDLKLDTLFIVPYKEMAVEGLYLPADGSFGSRALVSGKRLGRSTIESVIIDAAIPAFVLDEANVELEVSCQLHEPLWAIIWQDIRKIGGREPEAVIEQARLRFMAIYRIVAQGVRDAQPSIAAFNARPQAPDAAGTSVTPRK